MLLVSNQLKYHQTTLIKYLSEFWFQTSEGREEKKCETVPLETSLSGNYVVSDACPRPSNSSLLTVFGAELAALMLLRHQGKGQF